MILLFTFSAFWANCKMLVNYFLQRGQEDAVASSAGDGAFWRSTSLHANSITE